MGKTMIFKNNTLIINKLKMSKMRPKSKNDE